MERGSGCCEDWAGTTAAAASDFGSRGSEVAVNDRPSNRDAKSLATDESPDAISLQSWIVSVYGSPIGTEAVSAWARGAASKPKASTASTIDRFTPSLCGMWAC